MAKFERLGRASELMGAATPDAAATGQQAPQPVQAVEDDTERDILFFTFSGKPSDRRFLTALSEVQRCVLALGGSFVPLRADAPRGIYGETFIMVSFCIPVTVMKGQAGTLPRNALIDIAFKTDPALCEVLKLIEGGSYDGSK